MGLYAGQIQGGSPGRGRKGAVVVAVVVSCSKMKACYSGFLNKAQVYIYIQLAQMMRGKRFFGER